MNLVDFLISKEAITVYLVIAAGFAVYAIIYFVKKFSHNRLMKKNTAELNNLVLDLNKELEKEEAKESVEKPIPAQIVKEEKEVVKEEKKEDALPAKEVSAITPSTNTVKEDEIEVLDIPDIPVIPVVSKEAGQKEVVNDVKEEKQDIKANVSEIRKEPVEENKGNIVYAETIEPKKEDAIKELEDTITKLEEEDGEDKNIPLTEFEKMQEDTAIISIDELMKKAEESYDENDKYEASYQDEGNEPITIEELELKRNAANNEKIEKEEINEKVKEEMNSSITPASKRPEIASERKFKRSPVISPVFGIIRKEKTVNELELENTANYEKLDEEIRKTNEFMGTLKELKKKLN